MLRTNVDKVLEVLNDKKSLPLQDIAKRIGESTETLMKTAEYLEEEGLLRIEYKFMKPYLTLIEKKQDTKAAAEDDKPFAINKNLLDNDLNVPEGAASDSKEYASLGQEEISTTEFPKEISPLDRTEDEEKKKKEKKEPDFMVLPFGGGGGGGEGSDKDFDDDKGEYGGEEEGFGDDDTDRQDEDGESPLYNPGYASGEGADGGGEAGEGGDASGAGGAGGIGGEGTVDAASEGGEAGSAGSEGPSTVIINAGGSDRKLISLEELETLIEKANEMLDKNEVEHINDFYEEIYNSFEGNTAFPESVRSDIKGKLGKLFVRIKKYYLDETLV